MRLRRLAFAGLVFTVAAAILQFGAAAQGKPIRGWLSDEGCARGRANSGVYTPTNPNCARQCVAKGAKIVLILPEEKQILEITNQEAAKENVGNFVEITGTVDAQAKTLHIDALKFLEKGVPMCLPPAKKSHPPA